jgi:hypothetical protein
MLFRQNQLFVLKAGAETEVLVPGSALFHDPPTYAFCIAVITGMN